MDKVVTEFSWLVRLIERGRHEKFMDTIEIDVSKARHLLEVGDPDNRKIAPVSVQNYAHDMLLGQWLDNGEAICLSKDGIMMNGHHRANAVIMAGETNPNIAATFTFIFGLEPDVRRTYDLGKARSSGDRFKIEMKVDHGTALASAIAIVEAFLQGRRTIGGKDAFTIQDILRKYAENKHVYDNAASRIAGIGLANKLGEAALIAAYLILSSTEGMSVGKVNIFFDQLIREEEIDREGHIAILRQRLSKKAEKRSRGYRPWEKLELILRYWAYWINDRSLSSRPLNVVGSYPKVETGNTPFTEYDNGKE